MPIQQYENMSGYGIVVQKLMPVLLKQQDTKIEITQPMDAAKNITQDTIEVFKNQNIQRRSKWSYTINCYQTTSNILINSPYIDSSQSNKTKKVTYILEENKIQIQSANSYPKIILSNKITYNPSITNK